MEDDEVYRRALAKVLHLVSIRPRSTKELRQSALKYTRTASDRDAVVEAVCLRMQELGYADDRAFVRWWITARSGKRAKGKYVLRMELLKKGVSRAVIDEIFDAQRVGSVEEEVSKGRVLVERKRKVWATLPEIKRKSKLYGLLKRRGFSPDSIRQLVDETGGVDYN